MILTKRRTIAVVEQARAHRLSAKVQAYIAHYQAKVDDIRQKGIVPYHSGKTNLDYAMERVQIWERFASTL